MTPWFRVFGSDPAEPQPAALCGHLLQEGLEFRPHFRGDEAGWYRAEFVLAAEQGLLDRKSTRLKLQSHHDLVCRLLLEKKKKIEILTLAEKKSAKVEMETMFQTHP